MFLRNAWYVGAWDTEIGSEPLARTLLGETVVLFRTADGAPVALEDRCCHRQLPLSKGKVIGEEIQCRLSRPAVRPPGPLHPSPRARPAFPRTAARPAASEL